VIYDLFRILAILIGFALFIRLAWIVFSALRSGTARVASGKEYKRRKQPVIYFAVVAVQSIFAVMLFGVLVHAMFQSPK